MSSVRYSYVGNVETRTNMDQQKHITFPVKYNLYKSLILLLMLYGCEIWAITEIEEKRIQAFDNNAHIRLLFITYHLHKTNKYVKEILNQIVNMNLSLAL